MPSRRHSIHAAALVIAMTSIATAVLTAQQQPAAGAPSSAGYAAATRGTRWLEGPGVAIKVLVEASNFGGTEVEVAEIVLQPGDSAATHRHGSHELIYVLEGVLDHVVNGETHRLEPGMVGSRQAGRHRGPQGRLHRHRSRPSWCGRRAAKPSGWRSCSRRGRSKRRRPPQVPSR